MYISYVASILSNMCMGYVSLAWLDSIPHIWALLQAIITLHQKVCGNASVELLL